MMRHCLRLLIAVLTSAYPCLGHAESWAILGPRAMGMGGTGVAVAEGGVAQYWNPAALAEEATNSKWGIQLPVGARAEFTGGVLHDANTLGSLASQFSAIQGAQKNGTAGAMDATKLAAFYQALPAITDLNQPGKGVLADIEGGANVKIGKFAFSVNNFTSVGGSPFVDTKNIGLGQINGGAGTGVSFTGANTAAPADPTQAAAANTIAASFNAGSLANLNALTNGALTAGGITTPAQLGNALVNFAATNGQSNTAIQQAATQISQNAGAVAPIIAGAASGNAYSNNGTNLTVRGGSFTEIAMGYGRQLLLPGLFVGGNLKIISGSVGYTRFNVMQKSSGATSPLKDYKNNTANSIQPGVDLGALLHVDELVPFLPFKPRAGLVVRNINSPGFKEPAAATADGESSDYPLAAQMRMGLAVTPLHFWNIAMDMDLTQNNTPIPGYRSRMFGLGTEVNVFNRTWINIPLRAGLMQNVADSSSKMAYTAGFGINMLHFIIDVGGSISSDEVQIKDAQKVPANASAAVQLGFMF